ncbi:MAG: zinc-ribbon domain-containing protein [Candidatus Bathyarchaeia archaeon]
MSYCPKCGNKVEEAMTFCPRCGASLKMEAAARPAPSTVEARRRDEKSEKGEKQEKNQQPEKGEKQEKGQHGYLGWLIGGVVLIIIGFFAYARAMGFFSSAIESALVILVIGVAIILVAVYLSTTARKRHPRPA